jgi:hypothetical protein
MYFLVVTDRGVILCIKNLDGVLCSSGLKETGMNRDMKPFLLFTNFNGAEPFSRCRQLCRYINNSQHFMELECYYSVHKSPLVDPILIQINLFHTTPSCLSKIHLNIHPHTSWSSEWSLSFWLSKE